MGDPVIILPLKIYELVNGNEVYLYDQDWKVPFTTVSTPQSLYPNEYKDTLSQVVTICNVSKVSFFHGKDSDAVAANFSYGSPVDISVYAGKTIRCHLKSNDNHDRCLELQVVKNTYQGSNNTWNISYDCILSLYLDGSEIAHQINFFTLGGEDFTDIGSFGTSYVKHLYSLPFPSQNLSIMCKYHLYKIAYQEYPDPSYSNYKYNGNTSYYEIGSSDKRKWTTWFAGYEPKEVDQDNPYAGGGTSEIGGGNGNFSENSDTPETDNLPGIGAIDTGFATLFTPSASQLRTLSGVFWNSTVFNFLHNLVTNITDLFISLAMVPFNVEAGRTVTVTWLGIESVVDLTLAAAQYYEFDMGSIDMANDNRIFTSGSVLDYSPFSKLGIFLPFIGYQELDIDECRNAVLNLRYRIDILSGACVAILKVGGKDLYQFTGNCLTQIPITNENMQSLVSDAVNVGIAASGVAATGASVGADLAEAASSKTGVQPTDIAHAHQQITRSESALASATVNAVIGGKPTYNKSGAISSSASMMSVRQPYLFLSTPRQSIPDHYQRYKGFPSNITSKLGNLSGFTVVEDIRLNGLVATSPEVAEIYDLLKKGVII